MTSHELVKLLYDVKDGTVTVAEAAILIDRDVATKAPTDQALRRECLETALQAHWRACSIKPGIKGAIPDAAKLFAYIKAGKSEQG